MNSSEALQGKIAVVTGASGGVGRAICNELAAHGATVFGAARTSVGLAETGAMIQRAGHGKFVGVRTDVTVEADVCSLFARVAGTGPLDILVNNAGAGTPASLLDIEASDWDFHMAINARSVFLCTREAARYMVPRKSGDIIILSSMAGKRPIGGFSAYSASKHAAVGFAGAISREVRKANIRVCCLCPGAVATSMRAKIAPAENSADITQPEAIGALIACVLISGARMRDLSLDIF
jgi:NAD(P)-dependent dehydrogenase (short-subunit alcohol dehydrogenase family)